MAAISREATLVLIPTKMERQHVTPLLSEHCQLQLCGFGPVVSGIEVTSLLAGGKYQRVALAGIAGTYDAQSLPVGSACSFQQAAFYGIGAGEGPEYQNARELGFEQLEPDGGPLHYEALPLEPAAAGPCLSQVLTVPTAASNADQVAWRQQAFPHAVAEDMEAYSVAMAAAKFGLSVTVIRGISNQAGDRDHAAWEIGQAMRAAGELLMQHLALS